MLSILNYFKKEKILHNNNMSTTTNFRVPRDLLGLDNVNSKNARIKDLKVGVESPLRTIPLADQAYTFIAFELPNTYFYTGATSAVNRNLTLPSAAAIVAAIPGAQVGDVFTFTIDNTQAGVGTKTVVLGAGTTSQGTLDVAQNEIAVFEVVLQNVTSGSEAVKVIHNISSSSGGTSITLDDGSAAAPSLNFVNDLNTGLFHSGIDDNTFRVTANGVDTFDISPTGAVLNVGGFSALAGGISVAGGNILNQASGLNSANLELYSAPAGSSIINMGTDGTNAWTIAQPGGSSDLLITGLGTFANQPLTIDTGTAVLNLDTLAVEVTGDLTVAQPAGTAVNGNFFSGDATQARTIRLGTDAGNSWQFVESGGASSLTIQGAGTYDNQQLTLDVGTNNVQIIPALLINGIPAGVGSHLITNQATVPTITGQTGDIAVGATVTGTDMAGFIEFTTTAGSLPGTVSLAYNQAYLSANPVVVLTPLTVGTSWAQPTTGVVDVIPLNVLTTGAAGFTVQLTTPTASPGPFRIFYQVISL